MDTQSSVMSKSGVQKIGKPVSPEFPKEKDANVNVRDRFNDVLADAKHVLVNYQIAINEMIDNDARQLLMGNRDNLQALHDGFFTELFNLGEYQADMATNAQIADVADVFNGYKTQFPFKQ